MGTGEKIAKKLAQEAQKNGFYAEVLPMNSAKIEKLAQIDRLLVVTSTYGDGEFPDNGHYFWKKIEQSSEKLGNLYYAVLALGDREYPNFCRAGKLIDEKLSALGAKQILARTEIDGDSRKISAEWINKVLIEAEKITSCGVKSLTDGEIAIREEKYSATKPFMAKLKNRIRLSGAGSSKEIIHLDVDVTGMEEEYRAGDILNIKARNSSLAVERICQAAKISVESDVQFDGKTQKIGDLLAEKFEIRTPSKEFFDYIAEHTEDGNFLRLQSKPKSEAWKKYIYGKETADFIREFADIPFSVEKFLAVLPELKFRAYSISSSGLVSSNTVSLTVGRVIYEIDGEKKYGVASNWLAEIENGAEIPVFFFHNPNFKIPENPDKTAIMVGAGTGIAPFRAFLQEREARGDTGKNWLFFGDRNREYDFIYQEELENWQKNAVLNHLELAFSRDQAEKIYVQDKLQACAREIFSELENGAVFYICGDASKMAKDVEAAVLSIIAEYGQMEREKAAEYLEKLKNEKRFLRDVY